MLCNDSMHASGGLETDEQNDLEPRQYMNGFASVKNILVLKLPRFFPCHVGEGKSAAVPKQTCFFTEASPFLYCLSSNALKSRY